MTLTIIFMVKKYLLPQERILGVMIYFTHIKFLFGMNTLEKVEQNNGMMTNSGLKEITFVIKKIELFLVWIMNNQWTTANMDLDPIEL
jgi:hypothetical protein